jgi:hypothetical protein
MPNLALLTATRASATVDFGAGGVVHLDYYPQRLTSAMLLTLAEADPTKLKAATPERQLEVIASPAAALLTLLASWDLTETDPESGAEVTLPLDAAHIDGLGISVQWTLLGGLLSTQQEETVGKPAASEDSATTPASDATS